MSLKTFKESISKAKRISEDAGAVAELTAQMASGGSASPETTTVTISAEGVNLGQLSMMLKKFASPKATVEADGETITITSVNTDQVARVLKMLRIPADVKGSTITVNAPAAADETPAVKASTGTLGESWVRKTIKKLSKIQL